MKCLKLKQRSLLSLKRFSFSQLGSLILVSLGLIFWTSSGWALEQIALSNPFGSVGDMGSLYVLAPQSASFHLNNNDYLGATDKLMTGSMHAEYVSPIRDSKSYSIHTYWRFLTPAFKPKFGEPDAEKPIGRFGDMLSVLYSESTLMEMGSGRYINTEIGLGLDHFGNKGAKGMQTAIHRIVGSQTDNLTYSNQPNLWALNPQLKWSWIPRLDKDDSWSQKWGLGINSSEIMDEISAQYNLLFAAGSTTFVGWETRVVRQLDSRFYDEKVNPWRYEMAASVNAFNKYQLSVKWVSTYLQGDAYDQTYIDFLNYVLPI